MVLASELVAVAAAAVDAAVAVVQQKLEMTLAAVQRLPEVLEAWVIVSKPLPWLVFCHCAAPQVQPPVGLRGEMDQ